MNVDTVNIKKKMLPPPPQGEDPARLLSWLRDATVFDVEAHLEEVELERLVIIGRNRGRGFTTDPDGPGGLVAYHDALVRDLANLWQWNPAGTRAGGILPAPSR
jgi:hypothetical protein